MIAIFAVVCLAVLGLTVFVLAVAEKKITRRTKKIMAIVPVVLAGAFCVMLWTSGSWQIEHLTTDLSAEAEATVVIFLMILAIQVWFRPCRQSAC